MSVATVLRLPNVEREYKKMFQKFSQSQQSCKRSVNGRRLSNYCIILINGKKMSSLNYVPSAPSCFTCLRALRVLRAFVPYVP